MNQLDSELVAEVLRACRRPPGRGPRRGRCPPLRDVLRPGPRREPRLLEHRQTGRPQGPRAGPRDRPPGLHGPAARPGPARAGAARGPRMRPRPAGRTARADRRGAGGQRWPVMALDPDRQRPASGAANMAEGVAVVPFNPQSAIRNPQFDSADAALDDAESGPSAARRRARRTSSPCEGATTSARTASCRTSAGRSAAARPARSSMRSAASSGRGPGRSRFSGRPSTSTGPRRAAARGTSRTSWRPPPRRRASRA